MSNLIPTVFFTTWAFETDSNLYIGELRLKVTRKKPYINIDEIFSYSTDGTTLPSFSFETQRSVYIARMGYEKRLVDISLGELSDKWSEFFPSLRTVDKIGPTVSEALRKEYNRRSGGKILYGQTTVDVSFEEFMPDSWIESKRNRELSTGEGRQRQMRLPRNHEIDVIDDFGLYTVARKSLEDK
ncbi:MAG: hypothetical protein HYW24_00520 [Candidatus Aenigmarchaeota archaeon]|nr:hypothetical protein [Candidatus Aenigmarchaeota archaeon]